MLQAIISELILYYFHSKTACKSSISFYQIQQLIPGFTFCCHSVSPRGKTNQQQQQQFENIFPTFRKCMLSGHRVVGWWWHSILYQNGTHTHAHVAAIMLGAVSMLQFCSPSTTTFYTMFIGKTIIICGQTARRVS